MTTTPSPLDAALEAIRQRADKATKGPWDYYWGWNMVFSNKTIGGRRVVVADYCHLHLENREPEQIRDDMAFHADARMTVPALLRVLEEQRKLIADMSEIVGDATTMPSMHKLALQRHEERMARILSGEEA